jgi:phosphopantetheinyl transferase (holo-ACP synthase)
MEDYKTYCLLEQYLNESSQAYSFYYSIIDMRKMLRFLNHTKVELGSILSPLELEYLGKFPMPKKRIQWVSGRYAVKIALYKYKTARERFLDLSCIDVLNGIYSAPYLVQFPNIRISITHSYPYCIGVVSDFKIGIDLEKVMTLRSSLIKHYFNPNEIRNLSAQKGTEGYFTQAITYWTRKEAVSKMLGLGMKVDFKQIDTVNDSLVLNEYYTSNITLKSYLVSDYCFSLAIEGEHGN